MKTEDKQSSKLREAAKEMQRKKSFVTGNGFRKRAVATVRLYEGGKGIIVNGKSATDYFQEKSAQKIIEVPLKLVGMVDKFEITVIVKGGGKKAQLAAIRHAISRALDKSNSDFHKSLKKEGFLTRDPREKERKKPGLKRARRAPQWAKR